MTIAFATQQGVQRRGILGTPARNPNLMVQKAYNSLLPPVGVSPLDPKLPEMIKDWQKNVKDWNEGNYQGPDSKEQCQNYDRVILPKEVECESCGHKFDLFVPKPVDTSKCNDNMRSVDKNCKPVVWNNSVGGNKNCQAGGVKSEGIKTADPSVPSSNN